MTKLRETKELVNDYVNRKGISKNDLAARIGVSAATLTNIQKERDDLLKSSMLRKVYNYVADKKQKGWQYVATSNFNTIQKACFDVQKNHRMLSIIGYTGAGKTTSLRYYYRNNKNVYYIESCKSMRPKQFFKKLLNEMGIHYSGTIYDMIQLVAKELNTQENPLLIIDEAGKLSQTHFMYLHDLRNATDNTTGIILSGVEYFKLNLEKAVDKQKEGMPEFYDRVFLWQELFAPTKEEIIKICESNGIDNEKQQKEILRLKPNNFRKLYNLITEYQVFAQN